MAVETCWSRRTHLQAGLILVLLVLIPFLLAVACIFCLFGTRWMRPVDLDAYCNRTREKRGFSMDGMTECADGQERIRYPYILPITKQLYGDDTSGVILKCLAIQVSQRWVVANGICFRNAVGGKVDLKLMGARLGSNVWSKGGTSLGIRKVIFQDISSLHSVAAVELEIPDPFHPCIQPAELSTLPIDTSIIGQSFLWGNNLGLRLRNRPKFRKLTKRNLYLMKYGDKRCSELSEIPSYAMCGIDMKNSCEDVPAPVLDENNKLLGIHVHGSCDTAVNKMRFVYEHVGGFADWLRNMGVIELT